MSRAGKIFCLSPELLTIIVNLLEHDHQALLQLSYVSRAFNQLATPVIYYSYVLGIPRSSHQAADRFCSYMKTIIGNPKLARHVKYIDPSPLYVTIEGYWTQGVEDMISLMSASINSLCSGWLKGYVDDKLRQDWLTDIKLGREPAQYLLLLNLLPNLETLLLPHYGFSSSTFINVFSAMTQAFNAISSSDKPMSHIPPLSKLRTVRTGASGDESWPNQVLRPYFQLPSVRHLEFSRWDSKARLPDRQTWTIQPRSSRIEKLAYNVTESVIDEVCVMMGSCTSLKEFHLIIPFSNRFRILPAAQRQLVDGLLQHNDTLHALGLNICDSAVACMGEISPPSYLNSPFMVREELPKFEKLRYLGISHCLLFTEIIGRLPRYPTGDYVLLERFYSATTGFRLADYLPPHLEVLELFHCWPEARVQIQDLADHRRTTEAFQNLNHVKLHVNLAYKKKTGLKPFHSPGLSVEIVTGWDPHGYSVPKNLYR